MVTRLKKEAIKCVAILLSILLIITTFPYQTIQAFAENENLTITFVIKDNAQNAVQDANVVLKKGNNEKTGTSDINGNVVISGIEKDTDYDVVIEKYGYKIKSEKCNFSIDDTKEMNIEKSETLSKIIVNVNDKNGIIDGATVKIVYNTKYQLAEGTTQNGKYECTEGFLSGSLYVGNYNITVEKNGYETYSQIITINNDNESIINVTLVKELIDDNSLSFTTTPSIKVGEKQQFIATSTNRPNATVQYELVEGSNFATINSSTGEISATKTGTVKIKATIEADDTYKKSTIEHTFTIVKGTQNEFTFNKNTQITTYSQGLTYSQVANGGKGSGKIIYEIVEQKNSKGENISENLSSIDENTGLISISNAGTITIKATKQADDDYEEATSEYSLTIEKAKQTDFVFSVPVPNDEIITSNNFTNIATGGQSSSNITYEITNGSEFATVNSTTGEVTFIKVGTITVTATKKGDNNYNDISTSYNLTIEKSPQTDFKFNTSNPTNLTYSPTLTYDNIATGGEGSGNIIYEIIEQKDSSGNIITGSTVDNNGKLTIVNAGTITVKATKEADDTYKEVSVEYTITIDKAEQTGFVFDTTVPDDVKITSSTFLNIARGGQSTGSIEYSITNGSEFATIDSTTGEVSFIKVGEITVVAIKHSDNNYNDTTVTYTLNIIRDEQEKLVINGENDLTYNQPDDNKHQLTTTGGSGEGSISYEIVGSSDVINLDSATGEYTVIKSGTVKIVAKKAMDDKYNETTSDEFEITVQKANQSIVFDKQEDVDLKYGNQYVNKATEITNSNVSDGKGYSDNAIVYQIITGTDIADIDQNGKLTFKDQKVGTIVVKASKQGDDCYNNASDISYTINVSYLDKPNNAYEISGDKIIQSSDWYTKDIIISAPTGYSISFSNNLTGNNWTQSLLVTTEPSTEQVVYLKNGNDEITDSIVIPASELKLDTTKPSDLTISYREPSLLDKIIEGVTFGFYKADVTVEVSAKDTTSKIDYFTIKNGSKTQNLKIDYAGSENIATVSFKIEPQFKGKVSFTATDNAGNESETKTDEKIIVVDSVAPVIGVSYDNNESENGDKYKDNRKATITITEANFFAEDLDIKVEAKDILGSEVNVAKYDEYLKNQGSWTRKGESDEYTAEVDFDTDANYEISINYTDRSGNKADEYRTNFTVDKVAPTPVSVKYSQSFFEWVEKLFGFYKDTVTVTIEATDEISGVDYFTYSYTVDDGVSSTNVGKKDVKIEREDINYSGNKATATFKIPAQFRGKVSFTATDKAGNESATKSEDKVIVVDNVKPTIKVEYDNNEAYNVNYYNKKRVAKVTITEANFFAEDITDGNIVLRVGKKVGQESEYKYENVKPTFTHESGDEYSAYVEFSEDADYTFDVSYTDRSGNVADDYEEDSFTVDNTNPTIDVSYDNNSAENESKFKENRKAIIVINEHNFKESDVNVVIKAKNLKGEEIDLSSKDYAGYLKNADNWTSVGDKHTAEIIYDIEGTYEFAISYKDLSNRNNEEVKYGESVAPTNFTVDKSKPEETSIKYSEDLGNYDNQYFYKDKAVVTISAKDIYTKIDHFTYSYKVDSGVSSVNSGMENVVIGKDKITYSDNDQVATATFEIPAQFKGKVSFTATDEAGNTSEVEQDTKVIVVDTIAPKISVVYDNNTVYNTRYYNAKRVATITVEEANFYQAQDLTDGKIVVTVGTKKVGEVSYTYEDVKPIFIHENGDIYTATVEFAEDADYTFDVSYTDRSGNVAADYAEDSFTIDNTDPTIKVSYDNDNAKNESKFKESRIATIVITEHNFRADEVNATVTAKNLQGEVVTVENYNEYLKKAESWESVGDVHTAQITYSAEADYTFDISYTDLANRNNVAVDYGNSVAPKTFTVDKTIPTGNITVGKWNSTNGNLWDRFIASIKYILWSNQTEKVIVNVDDELSGIDTLEYFRNKTPLTLDEVKANTNWVTMPQHTKSTEYDINPDEEFVVYVHIVDNAGNEQYISSDGIVLDKTLPSIEQNAPEVEISEVGKPENGIFNGDVNMKVKVVDQSINGTFSGIKKVSYKVYNNDLDTVNPTQSGVLYEFSATNFVNIIQIFESDSSTNTPYIKVNSQLNNSNNVVVEITAEDNSGNITVEQKQIKIDITTPTIDVSYDNNSADSEKYFKADRIATIVVTERNFDSAKVVTTLKENGFDNIPTLIWTEKVGTSANKDDTTHTATILYNKDVDYIFDMSCKDLANNETTTVNYKAGTVASNDFTVDKTKPVIDVKYDNNSLLNGNYFKAERTATITINEHNFNADRVKITVVATDNGVATSSPKETGWSTNGDIHTATIHYSADALYEFNISYTDKAGNDSAQRETEKFYVDKTAPNIVISGVETSKAYNGEIKPIIEYTDTNFEVNNVKITLKGLKNGEIKTVKGNYVNVGNGQRFEFDNFANDAQTDDNYTLTVLLTDKAGNESTQEVKFSVNRFGSTYELPTDIAGMNEKFVQNCNNDVVLVEKNPNKLSEIQITLFVNGGDMIVLQENSDYKVDIVGSDNEWYTYTYTIFKKNFEKDGTYKIEVVTKDMAGNIATSTSDDKNSSIVIMIDNTEPEINIMDDLIDGARFNLDNLEVNMSIKDNMKLQTIIVYLNGEEYQKWDYVTDKEMFNKENFIFNVKGASETYNIKIVAIDEAGNTLEKEIDNILVTTDVWVQFINNTLLFYSTIGGVILILALGVILTISLKNRKREKSSKEE